MVPEDGHATHRDEPLAVGEQPDRLVVVAEIEVERGEAGVAQPDQPAEDHEPDDDGDGEQDHGGLGTHAVDERAGTNAKSIPSPRAGASGDDLVRGVGRELLVDGELVRLDGAAGGCIRSSCGLRHARPTVPGTIGMPSVG